MISAFISLTSAARHFSKWWASFVLSMLVLTGCMAGDNISNRLLELDELAQVKAFQRKTVHTPSFSILAYVRLPENAKEVVIYIEGDGSAWLTRTRASRDPTPRNPIGFKLAQIDPAQAVIYLARPCQFVDTFNNKNCTQEMWTNKRYGPEIVDALGDAISILIQKTQIKKVHLVGYSGGGTIALLLAAKSKKIVSVKTIAGNIDPSQWVRLHGLSALTGSLDPMTFVEELQYIPQIHFSGKDDDVMPPSLMTNYKEEVSRHGCFRQIIISEVGHTAGWVDVWPSQVTLDATCLNGP